MLLLLLLLWPRPCHCTRQPLVYGCSPHSPVLFVLHVASCSVRCSSLQSSLIMSIHLFFCLPSFWFHVHIRCMLFWGIVRSSSDSDVQSDEERMIPQKKIVEYVYTIHVYTIHGRDLTQDEQVAYLHPTWNNESFTVPRRLHPP